MNYPNTRWLQTTNTYCLWVCKSVGWFLWSGWALSCLSDQPPGARRLCCPFCALTYLWGLASVGWSRMTSVLRLSPLLLAPHLFLAQQPRPVPLEEAEEQKTGWNSPSWDLHSKLTHCYFCFSLLTQANHKACPVQKLGRLDSTSYRKEHRIPLQSSGHREGWRTGAMFVTNLLQPSWEIFPNSVEWTQEPPPPNFKCIVSQAKQGFGEKIYIWEATWKI